jgi:hypothetical protein
MSFRIELATMSFVWDVLILSFLGLVILLIIVFLVKNSSPTYEPIAEGVPAKVQAFVDDIVQNIRDIKITEQLRDFWKSVERTFNDPQSDSRSSTPKRPPLRKVPAPSKVGDRPQTVQPARKREVRCFACGAPVLGGKFCSNCGTEHPICLICRKPIWHGETVLECPFCKMKAHTPHLLEWLRVRGTCPNCKAKLRPPNR